MSADLPAELDVWRAVSGRRRFSGRVALADLDRLASALNVDPKQLGSAEARYSIGFDRDPIAGPFAELETEADLPLVCQRSLEPFLLPVRISQRLGLISKEEQADALPEEYEPVLVPESGLLAGRDLVEDELILAVPAIPIKPGGAPVEASFEPTAEELAAASPFAVLAGLKPKR